MHEYYAYLYHSADWLIFRCLRQLFSVQDCLPDTYLWTENQVSKICRERIQVYFEYNSLCTNAGLININLMTSWQNEQNQKILIELQHCVVKTNVTGSDHFKQKVISINSFYLTFQNKQILNWLRRVRYLFSYNLQYLKLILSGKSSISFHKTLLLSL